MVAGLPKGEETADQRSFFFSRRSRKRFHLIYKLFRTACIIGGIIMQLLTSVIQYIPRPIRLVFVYTSLLILAMWGKFIGLPSVQGLEFSYSSIPLFILIGLFGPLWGGLAAIFVQGYSMLYLDNPMIHLVILLEFLFICILRKHITTKLLLDIGKYWVFFGVPLFAISYTIQTGGFNDVGLLLLMKEPMGELFNAAIASLLLFYTRLRRFTISPLPSSIALRGIIYQIVIAAVLMHFHLNVGFHLLDLERKTDQEVEKLLNSSVKLIQQELDEWSAADLRYLELGALLQVGRLELLLDRYSSDVDLSMLLLDQNQQVLGNWDSHSETTLHEWTVQDNVPPITQEVNIHINHNVSSYKVLEWREGYYFQTAPLGVGDLSLLVMTSVEPLQKSMFADIKIEIQNGLILFVASLLGIHLINRYMLRNVTLLANATSDMPRRIKNGEQVEWPSSTIAELTLLTDNFRLVTEELGSMWQRLNHLAYYDSLTDLPNRLLYNERIKEVFINDTRSGGYTDQIAICFMDIDRFKQINDSLGHAAGDSLLIQVADRLSQFTNEQRFLARVSGDEFVWIVEKTNEKEIREFATEILQALRKPLRIGENEIYVSSSMGIALYPFDSADHSTIVMNADLAMYTAKRQGGDTFVMYSETVDNRIAELMWLENGLRKALDKGQFEVHYQMRVSSQTEEVIGMEALIRWNHPDLGWIPPDKFIPLAEQVGLIIPIGEWVLRTACMQTKAWLDAGYPLRVSVNLSARQFHSHDFVQVVKQVLEETELPAEYLELEITEGFIIENPDYVRGVLEQLIAVGIVVSIDDFGTGYSSLGQLRLYPVYAVKIDRSFIRNVAKDKDNESIVKAIIQLAHGMNIKVVAEGIETLEEKELLLKHHCDEMQGYYFAKAVNREEFEQWLNSNIERRGAI
jgi:diguanylate cyclase (GGDEF)-like protein